RERAGRGGGEGGDRRIVHRGLSPRRAHRRGAGAPLGALCLDLAGCNLAAYQEAVAMPDTNRAVQRTASVEARVDAIQSALDERGMKASEALEELGHLAQEKWIPENGARVVARAWIDPGFRERLLANGRAAVADLGLAMPRHHRHLVVLENTAKVQNVICCTLCSCTAFTIVGLPPDGTRTSNTVRASCANRAPCFARWGWTCRATW